MPDLIRLLPDSLANQIAAGEVVQRPASVVKELLENSIDAGSTKIQLVIKDAGKQLIQVIDNGKGMSQTDARMSFERHATSKLATTEDLFNIQTLGFRGEALPSIAAVAQVELKTRKADEELGFLLKIEGSQIKAQESCATTIGSSISVKNLFFNVPARRNFLKSNPVETKHILEEFQRVALSFPEIGFSFFQNDMEIYNLPSENLSKRIVGILGNGYKDQLIHCQEETDLIKIKGFIGKPENAKKTRGEQYFFVNNRFIKNNYLHHAVKLGYNNLIPDDHFPFYTLFLEIDPIHIDINVHPTKTEIKFDDERTIYAIMLAAIKKALATHNITPSLDFDQNINFNIFNTELNTSSLKGAGFYGKPSNDFFRENKNLNNWDKLYQNFDQVEQNDQRPIFPDITDQAKQEPLILGSRANLPEEEIQQEIVKNNTNSTFQLHLKYIVSQVKSGMVVIDQQAAHERILYERYQAMLNQKSGASQQTLFPQSIELSPTDFALTMELEKEIAALGFQFNQFGKNTIVINGIPADLPGSISEAKLFEGLLEQFKFNQSELKLERKENMARAIAKKSSIKAGVSLSILEMRNLIDNLFACKVPNYGPSGNPTFVILDLNKIEKFFNK
jgi:DNA mismatch repair protein MutL